jgi:hypothetical protein
VTSLCLWAALPKREFAGFSELAPPSPLVDSTLQLHPTNHRFSETNRPLNLGEITARQGCIKAFQFLEATHGLSSA